MKKEVFVTCVCGGCVIREKGEEMKESENVRK